MPPLDWARPLIPVADADGLPDAEADEPADADGLADAEAAELAAGEVAAAVGEGEDWAAGFSPE
jgi:hypothetical protein